MLYAVTHNLGGVVDIVVVSDGAGGYSCSKIAEWTYKLRLTDPEVGRNNLPRIRIGEMMNGAEVVGAREVFFLYEPDVEYTTNVTVVLDEWWDVPLVQYQLEKILARRSYDFVVVLLPTAQTHGEHAAASLIALQAVQSMPAATRPLVLGGSNPGPYAGLPGFPITSAPADPSFAFNRSTPIGDPAHKLDYTVIANTVISKHLSQGCLQTSLDDPPQLIEYYWYFDLNLPGRFPEAQKLFSRLTNTPYVDFLGCA